MKLLEEKCKTKSVIVTKNSYSTKIVTINKMMCQKYSVDKITVVFFCLGNNEMYGNSDP